MKGDFRDCVADLPERFSTGLRPGSQSPATASPAACADSQGLMTRGIPVVILFCDSGECASLEGLAVGFA